MKKAMRAFLSLLSVFVFLAGCSNRDTATAEKTSDAKGESDKPDIIRITKPYYFGDASDNLDYKKEWPRFMEEKFGIKFEMNFPPRNNYLEKVNLMITSGDLSGIVLLFDQPGVRQLKKDEVIYELGGLLKDNATWNSFEPGMRAVYDHGDGVWAVPIGYEATPYVRCIRKDWLDMLGLNVPETVEDLYETAEQFTLNDPDGNGVDDTVALTSSGTWHLQDIFFAFDCSLNDVGEGPYMYNPRLEAVHDALLMPGMVDALTYLNKMYENGYLDKEIYTNSGTNIREKLYSGKYGSIFYTASGAFRSFQTETKKNVPEAEFTYLPKLTGKITKDMLAFRKTGAPYILLSNTEQAKKMINAFVDIFYGDEMGFLYGRYGIEGKNGFELQEDRVFRYLIGKDKYAPSPEIVSWFSPNHTRADIDEVLEGKDESYYLERKAYHQKLSTYTDEAMEIGYMYYLEEELMVPESQTLLTLEADVQRLFDEAMVKAITGELSPQEAIRNYRIQMKAIGAQQILEEMNSVLGKESPLQY